MSDNEEIQNGKQAQTPAANQPVVNHTGRPPDSAKLGRNLHLEKSRKASQAHRYGKLSKGLSANSSVYSNKCIVPSRCLIDAVNEDDSLIDSDKQTKSPANSGGGNKPTGKPKPRPKPSSGQVNRGQDRPPGRRAD